MTVQSCHGTTARVPALPTASRCDGRFWSRVQTSSSRLVASLWLYYSGRCHPHTPFQGVRRAHKCLGSALGRVRLETGAVPLSRALEDRSLRDSRHIVRWLPPPLGCPLTPAPDAVSSGQTRTGPGPSRGGPAHVACGEDGLGQVPHTDLFFKSTHVSFLSQCTLFSRPPVCSKLHPGLSTADR